MGFLHMSDTVKNDLRNFTLESVFFVFCFLVYTAFRCVPKLRFGTLLMMQSVRTEVDLTSVSALRLHLVTVSTKVEQ